MTWRRVTTAILVTAVATVGALAAPASAPAGATPSTTAPGGPGQGADFLPSDKAGFGTSATRASHVWYTLQPGGGTGEIYFPSIGTPAARRLGFVVTGPGGYVARVDSVGTHRTVLADPHSLTYKQVDTVHNRWQLTTTYVTDPARSALRVAVHLDSLDNTAYRLYALYEPTLSDSTSDDSGTTNGTTLVASDADAASAFLARPAFSATSNGYRGASDGWTDLSDNGRMDWHYTDAPDGNIVQTGQTTLTGRSGHRYAVLTIGYGKTATSALNTAVPAAGASFTKTSTKYAPDGTAT